jgi:hypothetical protein
MRMTAAALACSGEQRAAVTATKIASSKLAPGRQRIVALQSDPLQLASMPPRRSAVDARNAEQATALSSLPLPLQHRIFLTLAVDMRARCCCVCRGWRDALACASLWTRLDLSRYSGITVALTEAVVEGAVRRARGQLYRLDFRYRHDSERNPQLMRLAPTFADSLRELRLGSVPTRSVTHQHDEQRPDLSGEALLTALPRLELLELDSVDASYEEAQAVLRAEAPWTALRFRSLALVTAGPWTPVGPLAGADRVLPFAAALADTSLQPTLSSLTLYSSDLHPLAVMNAVVDGVLARRLPELELLGCSPPAAAPLARLLGANVLTSLSFLSSSFHMPQAPPFDAAGALLLAEALRSSTALTNLSLIRLGMCRDMDAALTVLRAVVGHPSLRSFKLWGEGEADRSVLGTALSALIAANAPALEELNFASSELGVLGLTPIVEALPLNHHLLKLHIPYHNMDEAFAAEVLLPAVRANTSLRVLYCTGMNAPGPAKEAEELVERRRSLLR